jgi:hypothetical protein
MEEASILASVGPAPLLRNRCKYPRIGDCPWSSRHRMACGALAHGIEPEFPAMLMLQCNMAGVADAGPLLDSRPIMRPSPSLSDIDHSVPVLRLIVAGVFLLALFIIATIGSTAPADEDPMRARLAGVLDPSLRNKLAHYSEIMAAPRPMIEVDTPEGHFKADNCAAFIALAGRDARGRGLIDHPLAPVYQECSVMRLLHNARQPEEHVAPLGSLARAVVSRLDPVSLHALAPAWAGKSRRLADVAADSVTVTDRRIDLARGDARWSLEVVASVDVAGSPVEDLLVRVGRGSGDETFMVLMSRNDGAMAALPLSVFVVGGGLAMAQAQAQGF